MARAPGAPRTPARPRGPADTRLAVAGLAAAGLAAGRGLMLTGC